MSSELLFRHEVEEMDHSASRPWKYRSEISSSQRSVAVLRKRPYMDPHCSTATQRPCSENVVWRTGYLVILGGVCTVGFSSHSIRKAR